MRIPVARSVLLAAALGFSTASHAGVAGVIQTQAGPLTPQVTYTKAGSPNPFYVGYQVTVSNVGGNTVNNVRFFGWTTVTDPDESAPFSQPPANDATCSAIANPPSLNLPANARTISCDFGQMRAGSSVSFTVFFDAPVKDTNSPTPNGVAGQCAATDCVHFRGFTAYSEGSNDSGGSNPNDSNSWLAGEVLLGTPDPTQVKTAVSKAGGVFFTGGQIATSSDTWTTTVSVPATTAVTTAEILEEVTLGGCAADLTTCAATTLAIPGTFAKLIITLRRDASTIANGAKISSARIYYSSPTTPDPRITYPYEVLPCTDTTYGPLPQVAIPCLNKRTDFTKKTAPTAEWIGDWQFEIFALDNGRYSQ